GERLLDPSEPAHELGVGVAQRSLRIDLEVTRHIRHHEQKVAELLPDLRRIVARADRLLQLGDLLVTLVEPRLERGPTDSDFARAFLQLPRARQGGESERYAVEPR